MGIRNYERSLSVSDGTTGYNFSPIGMDAFSSDDAISFNATVGDFLLLKLIHSCIDCEHDVFIKNTYKN